MYQMVQMLGLLIVHVHGFNGLDKQKLQDKAGNI